VNARRFAKMKKLLTVLILILTNCDWASKIGEAEMPSKPNSLVSAINYVSSTPPQFLKTQAVNKSKASFELQSPPSFEFTLQNYNADGTMTLAALITSNPPGGAIEFSWVISRGVIVSIDPNSLNSNSTFNIAAIWAPDTAEIALAEVMLIVTDTLSKLHSEHVFIAN
jgi:hypothetical protein